MVGVILAAGECKRMNSKIPKCLFKVNGVTLLERQIGELREAGIDDIRIVVGYKASQITESVRRHYGTIGIVPNDCYASRSNAYSLYRAISRIRGDSVIVMNGDAVFTNGVIKAVANHINMNLIPIERRKEYWDLEHPELEMRMRIEKGIIAEISRGIPIADSYGQVLDIFSLNSVMTNRLTRLLSTGIYWDGYCEDALNDMIAEDRHAFYYYTLRKDQRFYDIDTPEDYKKVCSELEGTLQ